MRNTTQTHSLASPILAQATNSSSNYYYGEDTYSADLYNGDASSQSNSTTSPQAQSATPSDQATSSTPSSSTSPSTQPTYTSQPSATTPLSPVSAASLISPSTLVIAGVTFVSLMIFLVLLVRFLKRSKKSDPAP